MYGIHFRAVSRRREGGGGVCMSARDRCGPGPLGDGGEHASDCRSKAPDAGEFLSQCPRPRRGADLAAGTAWHLPAAAGRQQLVPVVSGHGARCAEWQMPRGADDIRGALMTSAAQRHAAHRRCQRATPGPKEVKSQRTRRSWQGWQRAAEKAKAGASDGRGSARRRSFR